MISKMTMDLSYIMEKLKMVRTDREKKAIYSFSAWLINKIQCNNLDYGQLQRRIHLLHNSNKGYYVQRYVEMKSTEKKQLLQKCKKYRTSAKQREYSKLMQRKKNKIFSLYNKGKLSKHSIKIIQENI